MLFTSAVISAFGSVIRSRGADYVRGRAIRSFAGGQWGVRATVDGALPYAVAVRRDGDGLVLSCTCPYFDREGPCKHLWAVLLLAESRGFLLGDGGPIARVDWDDATDEDLGDEELEDEESPPADAEPEIRVPSAVVRPPAARGVVRPRPAPVAPPAWRRALSSIVHPGTPARPENGWPVGREVLYVVDVASTLGRGLTLELLGRDPGMRGGFLKPTPLVLPRSTIGLAPDPADRRIFALLAGADAAYDQPSYGYGVPRISSRVLLPGPLAPIVLREACSTGRCFLREAARGADLVPLAWDDGPPWQLVVSCREEDGNLVVRGALARGDERRDLAEPAFLLSGGLLVMAGRVSGWIGDDSLRWVAALRGAGAIRVPASEADRLFQALERLAPSCRIELPGLVGLDESCPPPRPVLRLAPFAATFRERSLLRGDFSFDYAGHEVPYDRPGGFVRAGPGRLARRDRAAEKAAYGLLAPLEFRHAFVSGNERPVLALEPMKLPEAVTKLVSNGWRVEAEEKLFRQPGSPRVAVTSGVDWFDLDVSVDFGGPTASLPELLAALERREHWVRLGDGTYGLLPAEWLRRQQLLAGMGQTEGGRIRYGRGQAALLDALVDSEPAASCDAAFARVRKALARFRGVVPRDPPASFVGSLRPYQREGLGWLAALADLGFGGCLADDMGLGKTVQVLALLDGRRRRRAGPSLVVVPRSLVFNWKEEAARFTPRLRLRDHTGPERDPADAGGSDVVVTTYGTLKRDVAELRKVEWDYVVLDEAQAVKNAATATAKAVRLLSARHRLALSGTPIENHLGELWSLLDFLNPGVMGKASALSTKAARDPDGPTRDFLARAVRPFILRRTKEKVAPDLPEKVEQTLVCEMEPRQKKLYGELRDHYRRTLLPSVDRLGMARSKFHVLEALLRLRQVACHPGLVDEARGEEASAKLDTLLPRLEELREEGHRALVFSQFTSFLALLKRRLDAEGVTYEYLDGKTSDRAARVARFQSDPACPLFLISLKAGGLGLNLTAAGYVFLLDPWWNPAVEAQAVDRTHRIGQTRSVFAYRLITKETIEEKVAELQKTKRQLAESILSEDAGVLQTLRREDLEMLLS